jgi:serine/threonine protein kinase
MKDEDGERYTVKYFTQTWDRTAEILSAAFSREFDACCKLRHPCIIPTYGFSAATKQKPAAWVMKYMESGSLAYVFGLVKAGKPRSFWTHTGIAIIVVVIVCRLEFIHSEGFVHRGLKASNFLIDKDGRCYRVSHIRCNTVRYERGCSACPRREQGKATLRSLAAVKTR